MKLKRTLSILMSAVTIFGSNAFAEHMITADSVTETITVSGHIDNNANIGEVSLNILKPGKTISELEEINQDIIDGTADNRQLTDVLEYAAQIAVNADGSFKIDAPIKGESGLYTVYVDYIGNTDTQAVQCAFVKKADNIAAIERLINAKSEEEAEQIINSQWLLLDFHNDLYSDIDKSGVAKAYYGLMLEKPLSKENMDDARLYFDRACVLQALEEGKADLSGSIDILAIESSDKVYGYCTKNNEKAVMEIQDRIKGVDCNNLADFKKSLTEAVICAYVLYPDGSGEVKNVITDFSDMLNIASPTSSLSVYANMSGKRCADLTAVKAAYEAALKNNGAGSASSGRGSGKDTPPSNVMLPSNGANPEPVEGSPALDDSFVDMEQASWAKEAVAALAEKKIIEGVGDNKFAPNDAVTREQFAAMIVKAFNLIENETQTPDFDDVNKEDWYYPYVSIAVQNQIAKGMGTSFGIGMSITRQDMAVMIFNTAKKIGFEIDAGSEQNIFSDENEISEYAREAVKSLNQSGIINGVGDNAFAPKDTSTRAQAAVIIFRVLTAAKSI